MAKPQKSSKRPIGKHVEQVTHRASEKLSSEVEKIVYKVMTNPGLENTIASAVQKGLIALIVRYWLLIAVGAIAFLFVHAVIVTVILATYFATD